MFQQIHGREKLIFAGFPNPGVIKWTFFTILPDASGDEADELEPQTAAKMTLLGCFREKLFFKFLR